MSQLLFILHSPQIHVIEVAGSLHKVEFKVGELPNDMKMIAFLAGELNNAATWFSTFANVSTNDCAKGGTFGYGVDNKVKSTVKSQGAIEKCFL